MRTTELVRGSLWKYELGDGEEDVRSPAGACAEAPAAQEMMPVYVLMDAISPVTPILFVVRVTNSARPLGCTC